MSRKPSLAEDAILDKVIFPCGVQPKIDGVRALQLGDQLTGRSMDPFKGFGITEYFSGLLPGGDGEMILGSNPSSRERLCSLTTGAMGRFDGITEMADLHWWLFDLVREDLITSSYMERYVLLEDIIHRLDHPRMHIVPMRIIKDMAGLMEAIAEFAAKGYEGTIIRNLEAPYKEGRATQKGQQIWRVKPWSDAEILVTGITEGEMNGNEAKKNTLGRTERSSAKAGMIPNAQVGSIQGTMLADFKNPLTGELMFAKDLPITVGSGEMSVAEAEYYFQHPDEIVGHIVKFKHMTHGVKDLPRFPTYISHRLKQDL